jgi:hypothetical protein
MGFYAICRAKLGLQFTFFSEREEGKLKLGFPDPYTLPESLGKRLGSALLRKRHHIVRYPGTSCVPGYLPIEPLNP